MNASTNRPARSSLASTGAIDLAKNDFKLALADADHRIVARKRVAHGPAAFAVDRRVHTRGVRPQRAKTERIGLLGLLLQPLN